MSLAALTLLEPAEWQAVRLSVGVALCAVLASTPFAIATGFVLARRSFRGKLLVETLVDLPLVLPPVVTGYLLLLALGAEGPLGGLLERLGVRVVFTWGAAVLAAAVIAFPLYVRAARLAFEGVDERLEGAARTLGAGRFDAFASVSLPLARRGILAGAVLAFARSMGEFGATIMIAGSIPGRTRTIPLYVFQELQTPSSGAAGGLASAWRVVLFSVLVAALALVVSERFERRARARRAHSGRRAARSDAPSRERAA